MSLQAECWREAIPAEIAEIGERILSEDDPYRLIGEAVNDILSLEDFAPLYSEEGRGALCPIILGLVVIFQYLENIPDRQAAKWAVVRLDWKYALHVPLLWEGFHYSTLSYFRQRLLEQGQERLLFEKVLGWVNRKGLLKKQGKQRTDSTHILGQVANLSRLEMLWETLRLALRAIERAAPGWYQQRVPATFHEAYSVRQSDWQLSQKQVGQETKRAGQDGFWLLDEISAQGPQAVQQLEEVATLRTVWEQTFTRPPGGTKGGGKVRLRPRKRGQGKDLISTPHDKEARWAQKRDKEWVGYKLQVTETVEAEVGHTFVTDMEIVTANTGDSEALAGIQQRLCRQGMAPQEQIVDAGYISGQNLAASQKRGIDLLGPALPEPSHKPAGYRQQDFQIDWEQEQVTCPHGRLSIGWHPRQEAAKQGIHVRFGKQCHDCPARSQCAPGQQGRTLFLHAHYEVLQARRQQQQSSRFRERMKQRAAIESTISVLVRKHGARRARYRGQEKVRLQYLALGAAYNLKNAARALAQRRQTLARQRPMA